MGQLKRVALASCRWPLLLVVLPCVFLLSLDCPRPGAEAQTGALQIPKVEDGQWVMPAKNYASTRYSGLDQITTENIEALKVAWTFSTGLGRGHESAPLVVNNTMYIVTPFPNYLYALDLTQPGAKHWQPSAFSPKTGLLYIPHNNLCMDWESVEANYIAGRHTSAPTSRCTPVLAATVGSSLPGIQ